MVVGQSVPVEVFEVLPHDADALVVALTKKAVEAFQANRFDESAGVWKDLARMNGSAKLSDFYLDAIADAGTVVNGVIRLREK